MSSGIVPVITGTSKSSDWIQSVRLEAPRPHGSPWFSTLRSIRPASDGNSDSISTWYRRMSTMVSMCSMSTGHCSTQAPQVVQDHSTSGSMTLGTRFSTSTPAARFRCMTRSALANMLSRSSMMRSFGERGLPVFQAGHWDWQRPHSVQVARSSSCFHEKSSMRPAPNTTSSSSPTSSMDMSGVEAERAQGPWPAGGGHVDRGQEDVEVLRVGDEHQEAHDDGDVQQ